MKILIYSANYAPEPTGIGKYSGDMAAWLAASGHEVRVVAAPPYYPDWKIADSHKRSLYRAETLDGVKVWRSPLWVPSKPGGLSRLLHLMTFAASSVPVMLMHTFWRPDVVLTVAPAFVCAPMGWATARLCGAKSWLHIQDFEVDIAFKLGLLKGKALGSVARFLERRIFQRFDRISTISQRMMTQAATKGIKREALSYFPNWVDTDHIKPLGGPSRLRAELGLTDDMTIALYSGSFGGKQGLMMLPDMARRLLHVEQLVFLICGEGVLRAELEAACANLPNTRILPLQPFERLGELLSMADIHLLPQSPGAEDMVMPSKLSGMLASGRPTVATCRPDTEIATVIAGRGIVVPPDDVAAFADAVAQLVAFPDQRLSMGKSARRYAVDNLGRDAVLSRFASQATQLAGKSGNSVPSCP